MSAEQEAFKALFPTGGTYSSSNELLLKGWPGEDVVIMRGSRQSFSGIAYGTVVVVAQTGSARTVLGESNGTGLAERFMFVAEPSLLGSRLLLSNEPDSQLVRQARNAITRCVNNYSDRVFERWEKGIYEQMTTDDLSLIQPSPEGYKYIMEIKRQIEPRLGQLDAAGHTVATGWLGKVDVHILKMATVMHVMECLGAGSTVSQRIPMNLVKAAKDLSFKIFDHFTDLLADNGQSGSSSDLIAQLLCCS